MTTSVALSIPLFLLGIIGFIIPFRYGVKSNPYTATIDNSVFRLHYRLTFGFMIAFNAFLAATTLLEEPLDQMDNGNKIWQLLQSSCVIQSDYNMTLIGLGNTYELSHGINETIYERQPAMMSYYQILTVSLFIQALLFLLPYKLWTFLESGITQSMIDLYYPALKKFGKGIPTGKEGILLYLEKVFNRIPNGWFYGLVGVEFLNFVNVVAQLFFINALFNGSFCGESIPLFRSNLSHWGVECNHVVDVPMSNMRTSCFFERESDSGEMIHLDATCQFPRTALDEKFYMFLIFWLFYMSSLSTCVLICRFLLIFSPRFRRFWTRSRVRLTTPECYDFIFRKSTLSDWFLFDIMCKNFKPGDFNDLVNDFAKKLEGKKFRKPVDNYI